MRCLYTAEVVVRSRLDSVVKESMFASWVSNRFADRSSDLVIVALHEGAIELSKFGPAYSESSLHGFA